MPVRRKRGAVGVTAVSCWWEWDTNVFPLPEPTSLSEASPVFHAATRTKNRRHKRTDMHKDSPLKIEKKKGAHEGRAAGHTGTGHLHVTCTTCAALIVLTHAGK